MTDQKLLASFSQSPSAALSNPADPVRATSGNSADFATPIWALAAISLRSAPAMSGRCSSSAEGRPTGMAGGVAASGADGIVNPDAGCPTSAAIACSSCARRTPRSMDCARAVCSCVSACATSTPDARPPLYRFRVSSSARSYAATLVSMICFSASIARNSK